jgi:2-polyprenyl-6-methoxyphenol hydroxylase-like FAD-dependent oxidoreductase
MSASLDADVVIVGYGPVGQTLAALLAREGHRVAVYERFSCLYDLPRAVYFDDEIMQVWQSLGIDGEIDTIPVTTYQWFGADGEAIFRLEHPAVGPSGWEPGYCFYQPTLERALDRTVRALPSATVAWGWSAEGVEQAEEQSS